MLRGTTTFKCDACGHVFEGLDIEDNATVYTMPQPCPKCGAKCLPRGSWLRRSHINLLRDKLNDVVNMCI